jgi:hypothetical protein
MRWLKQSTAVEVKVGPFLDETDGKTAETGLTVSQADVRLAKNGGDWAQKNETTSLVHEENGWYRCLLDATDTNTLGVLMLAIHESGALPVWVEFMVAPANIWDSLFGADLLQVDAQQWLGGTIATPTNAGVPEVDLTHVEGTAHGSAVVRSNVIQAAGTAWGSGAITAGAIAADALTAAKFAADVATELNAAVLAVLGALNDAASDGDPSTTDTMVAYLKQIINTLEGSAGIATFPAAAAAGNGVSLAEVLRYVQTQVGAAGAGLTAVAWNAAWDAEVQSEVQDAIEANHLDHLLAADYDPASKPGVATALLNELVESDSGVSRFTANALEQGPGGGSAPTAAAIADAVWDEAIAGHLSAGSTGQALNAAGSAAGGGALSRTIRLRVGAVPIQGASIWVATDSAGSNVVAGPLVTDSSGVVTVLLDAGTYYAWARKDGYNPVVGEEIEITA